MACEALQTNTDLAHELMNIAADDYQEALDAYNSEFFDALNVCLFFGNLDPEQVELLFGMSPAELEEIFSSDDGFFDSTDVCAQEIQQALVLRQSAIEALAFEFATFKTYQGLRKQLQACLHEQSELG